MFIPQSSRHMKKPTLANDGWANGICGRRVAAKREISRHLGAAGKRRRPNRARTVQGQAG